MKHYNKNIQPSHGNLLFESRLPIEYYIFFVGIVVITLPLTVFIIIQQIDISSGLILLLFFSALIYYFTGRYLSRIKLYANKLEINYVFPWDNDKTYYFQRISDIDKRPESGLYPRIWFKKVYFVIDYEEVVELKYNISYDSDYKFIEILKKLAAKK